MLTQLVQLDPIYVVFNVSRAQAYEVQRLQSEGTGFKAEDMVVEVIMPDGKPYGKKGKVDFVSLLIDPTTDNVTARGILDNRKSDESGFELAPGQYAPVRLTVGNRPDALLIPQTAVVETQAGKHVYVVGDDKKVARRMIETGTTYKELLLVNKGLKEGEKIVAVGVQKVRDGIQVTPTAPSDAGQGGSEKKSTQ